LPSPWLSQSAEMPPNPGRHTRSLRQGRRDRCGVPGTPGTQRVNAHREAAQLNEMLSARPARCGWKRLCASAVRIPPSSLTVAVGQPVVEKARHGCDQSFGIALAGGTAGELDGSRQRSFDHEGIRPSAGEHRKRMTIRRREVGARNGKRSRPTADRSS
jgi:hypothetical protein